MNDVKLSYKDALIEEIRAWRPNLYSLVELEKMSEDSLKKLLDDICVGRVR